MDYRILTNWNMTGEITEQYFLTFGDADTVVDYLKRALENGARIGWALQEKVNEKVFETLDSYNCPEEWCRISWND